MALRFGSELRAIMENLGPDAADEDGRVIPLLRNDRCLFAVGNAVYTWSDGVAWRVHQAHGSERYEGWRNGRKIANIDPTARGTLELTVSLQPHNELRRPAVLSGSRNCGSSFIAGLGLGCLERDPGPSADLLEVFVRAKTAHRPGL
jgi:hypothetical protein